ncbi:gamma-glutamylcyclotransferase family protein [Tissierella sp.]|uniref:gamma-glutamylcyclotransferase family protein n=1 Tax=Tissierella sp. TaxID=41274 RepID=UPI00285FA1C9|nr:gamma-glutamylcyclotransferase family protein [Tissierella sp.]MDR7856513.1 gamma-glutamylcyclotransferase family protein [Tissierella sp.]
MLYFAYASNLSKEYMLSRCPDATPVKRAVLKDYKLVFNQLADIVAEKEKDVFGAIYVISKQHLEQLDKLEGYPDLYDRIDIEVEDEKGNKYDAFAYAMVEKNLELPPDHYYQILLKGYEDWNLSVKYLEEAKKAQ